MQVGLLLYWAGSAWLYRAHPMGLPLVHQKTTQLCLPQGLCTCYFHWQSHSPSLPQPFLCLATSNSVIQLSPLKSGLTLSESHSQPTDCLPYSLKTLCTFYLQHSTKFAITCVFLWQFHSPFFILLDWNLQRGGTLSFLHTIVSSAGSIMPGT